VAAVNASPVLAAGAGLPRTYQVQRIDSPLPILGGNFGLGIANAGDLDRDGEDDIIVPQAPPGNTSPEGQLFVFSGKTGRLIDTITAPDSGNPGPGNIPANFGFPFVDKVGLNRRSAPFSDLGSCPGGRSSQTCPNPTVGPADGIPDILVGARGIDVGGVTDIGRAYVIDGATRAVLKRIDMPPDERAGQSGLGFARSVYSPAASPPCEGNAGVGACDALPPAVVNGNLSGDQGDIPDILVGAWMYNETSSTAHPSSHCALGSPGSVPAASPVPCRGAGKEYMYRGEDIVGTSPQVNLDTPAWRLQNPVAQRDNPNTTLPTNSERFGQAAVAIGDVGGCRNTRLTPGAFCPPADSTTTPDGKPEVRFSVSGADYPVNNPDPAQFDVGLSLVVDGATGTFLHTYLHPEPQPKAVFGSSLPAGSQVPPVGDLGDTSLPDVFIPAPFQNVQFINQGRGYIMNGNFKTGVGLANLARLDDPTPVAGGNFSVSAVGVGDLVPTAAAPRNELLVGAFGPSNSPSTEIIPNDVQFFNAATERVLQSIPDPDRQPRSAFGSSLAPIGDLNGDGFLDFAAAAHLYDLGTGVDEGRVYVFRSDNSPVAPGPPTTTPTPSPPSTPPTTPPVVTPKPPSPPAITRRLGKLSARVTKAVDLRAPFRFRASGRLTLPSGVAKSVGCTGRVSVQVKRGSVTLSTRRVALRKDCTYAVSVSFANARRFAQVKRLKFTARFVGNSRVSPTTAPARFARVQR